MGLVPPWPVESGTWLPALHRPARGQAARGAGLTGTSCIESRFSGEEPLCLWLIHAGGGLQPCCLGQVEKHRCVVPAALASLSLHGPCISELASPSGLVSILPRGSNAPHLSLMDQRPSLPRLWQLWGVFCFSPTTPIDRWEPPSLCTPALGPSGKSGTVAGPICHAHASKGFSREVK